MSQLTEELSAILKKAERDEKIVRSLLGRWVSGADPSIVIHDNEVIGLCDADTMIGMKPFVLKPA